MLGVPLGLLLGVDDGVADGVAEGEPVGWAAGGDEAFSVPQAAAIPSTATTSVAPIRPRVRCALTTRSFRVGKINMMVDRSLTQRAETSRRHVYPVTPPDRTPTEPHL
ncbi:hypothetical protein GCM10009630_41670 [Kribbella jejuensis]